MRTFCGYWFTPAQMGSTDSWAGTYCKLEAGHKGDHSPLYPDERGRRPAEVATPKEKGT